MTRERLEGFYENELAYIRKLGAEFAKKRPKIAGRLLLKDTTGLSTDPHVERLIEAFAFLTARVRLKLEDEFPELTESLLSLLYPHYLAPIPSLGIAQFVVDPERGKLPSGYTIPRQSKLHTHDVRGVPCRFRTAYPVKLWPMEVASARYLTPPFGKEVPTTPTAVPAQALVRIELKLAPGMGLHELLLDRIRFFLSGDDPQIHRLYELLLNNVTHVVVRGGVGPDNKPFSVTLPGTCIQPVGFEADEGLLPYSKRSFPGYRLLTEYFSFPQKFLFVDLTQLEGLRRAKGGDKVEIFLFLNRAIPTLQTAVNAETFRLGCTPIVNLFEQDADPIRITQTKTEYLVLPDVRQHWATEVYSVDTVEATDLGTQETVVYAPLYSFKQANAETQQRAFWTTTRRPSLRENDRGTDVFLSLVDRSFNPVAPPAEVLTVRVTCSNRDLPFDLRNTGGEDWGFQLEAQAPIKRIRPVVAPTSPRRLPMDERRWRLIAHLSLNHLSISDADDGAEALREILKLYEYPPDDAHDKVEEASSTVSERHIRGILSVNSARKTARVGGGGQAFCRGIETTIVFNEEDFAGSGVFLFASVLERFLALYASINSATSLVARSNLRDGFQKQWPFRAGERTLL
jgi:type VI secretion system protein ImpG